MQDALTRDNIDSDHELLGNGVHARLKRRSGSSTPSGNASLDLRNLE
jgi:hypothetical protein